MGTNCSIDELKRRVWDAATGKCDASDLEARLKSCIRESRGDQETALQLRFLLGELYQWAEEPAKSRAQYRKVLEQDPACIKAMIGIGQTYYLTSRLASARKWFLTAHDAARRSGNYAGLLKALDELAFCTIESNDMQALSDALIEMCEVLATAPRMDGLILMIAERLIEKRKGALALPFLQCFIEHMLHHRYSRSSLLGALRPFIEIKRQEGESEEAIWRSLDSLRSLSPDPSVARDFDIVAKWALDRSLRLPHYDVGDQTG